MVDQNGKIGNEMNDKQAADFHGFAEIAATGVLALVAFVLIVTVPVVGVPFAVIVFAGRWAVKREQRLAAQAQEVEDRPDLEGVLRGNAYGMVQRSMPPALHAQQWPTHRAFEQVPPYFPPMHTQQRPPYAPGKAAGAVDPHEEF